MTPDFKFQMILRLADLDVSSFKSPPPSEFAALAAKCDEEKILSIDYLGQEGLKKALAGRPELTTGQEKLSAELKGAFCAYFRTPSSACFNGLRSRLPLCESTIAPRMEGCEDKLPMDECGKALEKVRELLSVCGGVCTYGKIGGQVAWGDVQLVKDKYKCDAKGKPVQDPLGKAVGAACFVNPFAIAVPCYRVLYAGGGTGFRLGELGNNPYVEHEPGAKPSQAWKVGRKIKRWLLEHEGNQVDGVGRLSWVTPRR